jgi:Bacterial protein of unknown function (DUF922)
MEMSGFSKLIRSVLLLAFVLPMLAIGGRPSVDGGDLVGDEIKWQSDFRLQWTHFKGKPDRASNMDALTESGITFSWSCDWRGFQLTAYAIFVPTGSWVKDPSSTLLAHEQAHFDITEIHARKLRKYFAEHDDPCKLGRAGIDKAAGNIINASYALQNEYDAATNHGQNYRAQKEWQLKIAAGLEAMQEYAD